MRFLAHHGLSLLAALLMLGGLFFWTALGIATYQYFQERRPVVVSIAVATESPQPTYIAIPTVDGQPSATSEPQITVTAVATESPVPTISVEATALPTVPIEPTSAMPTAVPNPTEAMAPTAAPPAPTEAPLAVIPVCPTLKNEVLQIEGTSSLPVASALALLYDGTYVGGGTIKPGGVFSIPLAKAPRVAGQHTIDVVLRGTETHAKPVYLMRTSCALVL